MAGVAGVADVRMTSAADMAGITFVESATITKACVVRLFCILGEKGTCSFEIALCRKRHPTCEWRGRAL